MTKKLVTKKSRSKSSESAKTTKLVSFENAIEELETLVEEMEQGDISLEESLKKFERGIELTRTCQKALQDAEQKVQMLIDNKNKDEIVDIEESDRNGS